MNLLYSISLYQSVIMVYGLSFEAIDFIAGSVGGIVAVTVGQPFDTVKVRIQTSNHYKGPADCFNKIIRHEGVSKLFSGMLPPLVTASLVSATVFSTYGYVMKACTPEGQKPSIGATYFAGCVAGLAQSFITCPRDLIKIQLQTRQHAAAKIGVMKHIQAIYATHGIRGLFRGYQATFYRDVPLFGAYFTTYSLLMSHLEAPCGPMGSALVSGGLAGVVFWSIIYPIDNVKTQIQMMTNTSTPTPNALRMMVDMFKTKGFRHVYRGLGTTVLRSLPVNAVLFPVYKTCVAVLSGDETTS